MARTLLGDSPNRPAIPGPSDQKRGQLEFTWNGRRCSGREIHLAVIAGDLARLKHLLKDTPELLRAPFTCRNLGSPQWRDLANTEMSGEPVHLAASKGHLEIVKELLSHRASLQATVFRDGRAYCEVLHTALSFEEGQKQEMIEFLLSQTEMTYTSTGRHPLHIAALSSKPALVCLVRHWMKKQGKSEAEIQLQSSAPEAPLSLAIRTGKMKLKDLVISAEPSVFSLKILVTECPEAVPLFLKRLEQLGSLKGVLSEAEITSADLAELILQSEVAAMSLMDAVTERPRCRDEEFIPLPSVVSFAPRDYEQMLWNLVNRGGASVEVFTALEPTDEWGVGDIGAHFYSFLTDTSFGRPFKDAEIRVCSIPDLLTPHLFAALASPTVGEKIFEHRLVAYAIHHIFQHHAGKVELTRCGVNLWILALLNLHTLAEHQPDLVLPGVQRVAVRFIAAQSVVDVIWELIELYGYVAIGRVHEYWQFENLLDYFIALVPLYLWVDPNSNPVLVLTVFLYWARVLLLASFCEPIGQALQPLTKIFRGLGPVLFLTVVAFASFCHVFFCLREQSSFTDSFHGSFLMLITAGLPDQPSSSFLEATLLYLSVTFFTVFILNIFIGVIGDEYSRLKEQCSLGFRQLRAKICHEFMLRKQFFRIDWCSKRVGKAVMLSLFCVGLSIQWLSAKHDHEHPALEGSAYVLILAAMHAVFYNSPGSNKLVYDKVVFDPYDGSKLEERTYFWFCCEAEREVEDGEIREITFS